MKSNLTKSFALRFFMMKRFYFLLLLKIPEFSVENNICFVFNVGSEKNSNKLYTSLTKTRGAFNK